MTRRMLFALLAGAAGVGLATSSGCVAECERYNDCPDGEYCSPEHKCLPADDGDFPGGGGGNDNLSAAGCTARIQSVNGANVAPNQYAGIDPLDDVIVVAEVRNFTSSVSYQWSILQKPNDSGVTLTTPAAATTGFTFDEGDDLGIDISGVYRLRARVSSGDVVVNCDVTIQAVPSAAFLVELSWESDVGDIDLHVIKGDASSQYCLQAALPPSGGLTSTCGSGLDCYFGNCTAGSSTGPDWNGDGAGGGGADPSLDIDDLCGRGPENINVDAPASGDYLVGVHFFGFTGCDGSGSVVSRARIYVDGDLALEGQRTISDGDFWEVAVVQWTTGANPCIEDLATSSAECP